MTTTTSTSEIKQLVKNALSKTGIQKTNAVRRLKKDHGMQINELPYDKINAQLQAILDSLPNDTDIVSDDEIEAKKESLEQSFSAGVETVSYPIATPYRTQHGRIFQVSENSYSDGVNPAYDREDYEYAVKKGWLTLWKEPEQPKVIERIVYVNSDGAPAKKPDMSKYPKVSVLTNEIKFYTYGDEFEPIPVYKWATQFEYLLKLDDPNNKAARSDIYNRGRNTSYIDKKALCQDLYVNGTINLQEYQLLTDSLPKGKSAKVRGGTRAPRSFNGTSKAGAYTLAEKIATDIDGIKPITRYSKTHLVALLTLTEGFDPKKWEDYNRRYTVQGFDPFGSESKAAAFLSEIKKAGYDYENKNGVRYSNQPWMTVDQMKLRGDI